MKITLGMMCNEKQKSMWITCTAMFEVVVVEVILISALLLAHLAARSQLLQTLCLDPIHDRL